MPSDFLAGAKRVQDAPASAEQDFLAGATPVTEHPPDMRNSIQRAFDEFQAGKPEDAGMSRWSPEGIRMRLLQGAGDVVAPLVHPLQSGKALMSQRPSFASMALGPGYYMAKGLVNSFRDDPVRAIPGAMATMAVPEAGGELADAATAVRDAIPSATRAGKLLDEVRMAAADKPVTFTRTTPALEEAQRLSMWGHGNVTPLDSLYSRINTVNPIDFEEARGRYSPLTRLTASDKMRATPQLQAAARRVAHAMREDIGDTAEAVGMRPQYEQGMSQYARAMRNRELASRALKWGAGAAATGGGLAGLYHMGRMFSE